MADTQQMALDQQVLALEAQLEQFQLANTYLQTEKAVFQQSLQEILNANITLRTGTSLYENQVQQLQAENAAVKASLDKSQQAITDLMNKLEVANKVIEASTNLRAPDATNDA